MTNNADILRNKGYRFLPKLISFFNSKPKTGLGCAWYVATRAPALPFVLGVGIVEGSVLASRRLREPEGGKIHPLEP